MLESRGDQVLNDLLGVAGFPHGADGLEQAVKCFAMADHERQSNRPG